MSIQPKLNERNRNILRATIEHYIATAEPVGSKTLLEEYNFSVSSATIRNILGQLEKAGLLYQPHTSAGRIPSDSGYRTYVDRLLIPDEKVGKQINQHLDRYLQRESWNFDSLLQKATQILANLSGYIALITMPQTSVAKIRHLQLVRVSSEQVMLVIVTDSYQTQSISIDISPTLLEDKEEDPKELQEELQILSNFLNSKLQGHSLRNLSKLDWGEIDREFARYTDFLKTVLAQFQPFLQPDRTTPMLVHGISEVLRQPEFSHLQQVQMLLHLLEEERGQLLPLIFSWSEPEKPGKRVSITIGSENPLEPMRPCTLISAIYRQGDIPVGSVGLIGPTRMLYENTIPLVESAADYLSEALS